MKPSVASLGFSRAYTRHLLNIATYDNLAKNPLLEFDSTAFDGLWDNRVPF